jgi:hypothetical protein
MMENFLKRVDLFGAGDVFPLMQSREIALFLVLSLQQYEYRNMQFYLRLSSQSVCHLQADLADLYGQEPFVEKEARIVKKYFRIEQEKRIWEERLKEEAQQGLKV